MRKTKKQIATRAFLALMLAEMLWGANKPVIKLGLQTIPLPLYLSVTILGTALLILPLALRDWKHLSIRDYTLLITGSIVTITIGNVALLMGLQRIPAVNASLIGLFGPILLFVFSIEFLKEKISIRTFIGLLIAFAGAGIIIGKPWISQGGNDSVEIGSMLILLSVMSEIIGTLITKSVLRRAGVYQTTFIHLAAGIVPIALFSTQYLYALSPAHAGKNGYAAMVFNIIAITFANCLFMYGLKYKKAQEIGAFSYISPITTIVAAWLIIGERPTIKIISAAMLIFVGIYLAAFNRSHNKVYVSRSRKRIATA